MSPQVRSAAEVIDADDPLQCVFKVTGKVYCKSRELLRKQASMRLLSLQSKSATELFLSGANVITHSSSILCYIL
jgi:hypothetical protein